MTTNISGFGVVINIIADKTFPIGFNVTQFSDDANAITFGNSRIADTAMGLNGELIKWSRAVPLPMGISVIPSSDDDINLQILADANRVAQGKNSADDTITATIIYPDGQVVIMSGGSIVDAEFGVSLSNAGRKQTKNYAFMFQSKT